MRFVGNGSYVATKAFGNKALIIWCSIWGCGGRVVVVVLWWSCFGGRVVDMKLDQWVFGDLKERDVVVECGYYRVFAGGLS